MPATPTRSEKLEDISRIRKELGCDSLSYSDYREAGGKFSRGQYLLRRRQLG